MALLRQKDIAAAAKLDPSTVSRALNNDPRLPAETRHRVLELAAAMGYRPDPLLSALASYRRGSGAGRIRPGMAYLRRARPPKQPYQAYHADLLRGAQTYAATYGYSVDYLPYERTDDPALRRVLAARGVRGLLIEPIGPEDARLKLDLERFAVVVVDNPFFSPDFDRVAFDGFGAGKEAVEQCCRRGYRRPGLVISETADRNGENKSRAGYLIRMLERRSGPPLEPLLLNDWNAGAFLKWLRDQRVDAVITSQAFIDPALSALASARRRVPEDVGLLSTNVHQLPANASGFHHRNDAMGAFAAEFLITKLARHEYGPSQHPHVISQRGQWVEAGTLRPAPPTSPK